MFDLEVWSCFVKYYYNLKYLLRLNIFTSSKPFILASVKAHKVNILHKTFHFQK